jgi:ferredoxin
MLPMIAEAEAAGADWRLLYGGRTRASMAFLDELAAYGEKVTLVPQDERGMPDLDAELGGPHEGTLVYACGPTGLLDAVETRCATWPPGSLHLERFSAKAVAPNRNTEFALVLQRSGLTLDVPADKSVYEVCRQAGVGVVGSCLEGICGTCETEVVDGDVDHRDSVLSEDEREANEYMMICVSRCRSAQLTLDL